MLCHVLCNWEYNNLFNQKEKAMNLDNLAVNFCDAFYNRRFSGDTLIDLSELSLRDAYLVQDKVVKKRVQKGETVVGYKVGCTSTAIREQFGLEEPIHGKLFKPHFYMDGAELFWNDFINCSIEPEMVLRIGKDLKGENLPDETLIKSIEYVSPGIELHNYKFWFSPTTSQELICSNGIHAGLIVGEAKISPRKLSFKNELFKVSKNGTIVTQARASEIMGGPLHSLRWLVGHLTRNDHILSAGDYVIPGSPVELITIDGETELEVEISQIGRVAAHFSPKAE
jgi:2-keto-4-pentenoate hydratase